MLPAKMKRLRALVLAESLDKVISSLGRVGVLHPESVSETPEAWGFLQPSPEQELFEKTSSALRRANALLEALGGGVPKEELLFEEGVEDLVQQAEELLNLAEAEVMPLKLKGEKLEEQEASCKEKIELLSVLREAGLDTKDLPTSRWLRAALGIVEPVAEETLRAEVEEETKKRCLILTKVLGKQQTLVLVVALNEEWKEVEGILTTHGFEALSIEGLRGVGLEEAFEEPKRELERLKREKSELEEKLAEFNQKWLDRIEDLTKKLKAAKKVVELRGMTGATKRLRAIQGWVPVEQVEAARGAIETAAKGRCVVSFEDPREGDRVPTKLKTPKLIRHWELITKTFGVPAYNEIDPTLLLAVTFPIFYGMMFGDVGHGSMLLLLGIALVRLFGKEEGMRKLGLIVINCSIPSMVFGLLYWEWFGSEELSHRLEEMLGVGSILPKPSVEVKTFLGIALLIGILHLSSGLLLDAINKLLARDTMGALTSPLLKLWLYWGAIYLFYTLGLDFEGWVQQPIRILGCLVAPLGLLMLSEAIKHRSLRPSYVFSGAFEVFDTPLVLLSNTVSYCRIFALALTHAVVFTAFFKITELLLGIPVIGGVVWLFSVVLGSLLIVGFESIIVFLHSLRLHYYEWFSKFYSATGLEFRPFRLGSE